MIVAAVVEAAAAVVVLVVDPRGLDTKLGGFLDLALIGVFWADRRHLIPPGAEKAVFVALVFFFPFLAFFAISYTQIKIYRLIARLRGR